MLTANKVILICLLGCAAHMVCAQVKLDTIPAKPFERYWTRSRLVPKLGVGVQGNAFAEVGFQYHKIYVHPFTLASAGPYMTCDLIVLHNSVIIGPKVGYELTAGLFGFAADVGYYSDFERESLLVTPKAGISILGFADLFYGRSFTVSDDSFKSISVSRFSLVINLNRDYFDLRDARRKRK